ncbi:lens fiber major intrinsic protein [Amniculicola lignicola CBS 123094]|uniref:Lens fiber major intrinsic protein n=1 Tax=Amniculicola lignicola CBS 123094 TaxID=1392246 RepID=A0A6A5W9H1_9PLEO|nr:lens fiber major intrinsic protein [Amniculicola lignicola CBS 123094]
MVLPITNTTNEIYPPTLTKSYFGERQSAFRREVTVILGEFLGTFMFLFLSFAGTQIANTSASINPNVPAGQNPTPEVTKLLYIAFAFGTSLAINVAIFSEISGGMFNPAVTTALYLTGNIKWPRAILASAAQLVAGICSAAVVAALLPGAMPVSTKLDASISVCRGLFLEMFLTAQLVLTILMLPASNAKPMYIGVALFVSEICGVYYTGGSLNPARSFGPDVVNGFQSYHWIYWVGPVLGAGLGSGVFGIVKLSEVAPPGESRLSQEA